MVEDLPLLLSIQQSLITLAMKKMGMSVSSISFSYTAYLFSSYVDYFILRIDQELFCLSVLFPRCSQCVSFPVLVEICEIFSILPIILKALLGEIQYIAEN